MTTRLLMGLILVGVGCADQDATTTIYGGGPGESGAEAQTSVGGGNDSDGESGEDDSSSPLLDLEPDPPEQKSDWPPLKLDFGSEPPSSDPACEGGELLFSYIWIANSLQGTVSKINTETLEELGRYRTSPAGDSDPSRTSVNLSGDMAIANRNGGLTKIYAQPNHCAEQNGQPGIQTSSGADDVLPWGVEECVAWHRASNFLSQRIVAWTQGVPQPNCSWSDQRVWTAGVTEPGSAVVQLLDGEDGSLVDQVHVELSLDGDTGPYGAVVDAEGNLWFSEAYGQMLTRVSIDDLSHQVIPIQTDYGIAIDTHGRIFTCGGGIRGGGIQRFDPSDMSLASNNMFSTAGGCMVDATGKIWTSSGFPSPYSLLAFDIDSLELVRDYPMPTHLHGISPDFAGYIWGVEGSGTVALRVDPETGDYDTVTGLVGAYTYSDMIGFALASSVIQ